MTGRILSLILLVVLPDLLLYVFAARLSVNPCRRKLIRRGLLFIMAGFLLFTAVILIWKGNPGEDYKKYPYFFLWMDVFLLVYLPKLILLILLLPLGLLSILRKTVSVTPQLFRIYHIFKNLWTYTTLVICFTLFVLILDGVLWGNTRFTIKRIDLRIANLPPGLDGLTIAQFSDIHLGSWCDTAECRKGLQWLQSTNPDLIVFTGDLINVNGAEVKAFRNMFRQLDARAGKFAVLGNHDLGDFSRINRRFDPERHTTALQIFYQEQGFQLLRNQHVVIHVGKDSILLAGVDNWGKYPFHSYGKLREALKGAAYFPFSILLSHDPTHWKSEVLDHSPFTLTLSGHTHGGQMGFDLRGWRWSPVKLKYSEWWGLYEHKNRFLYVNPGMGYIGFSGRIGIRPEITLITLRGT